jgi:hypothetical protein
MSKRWNYRIVRVAAEGKYWYELRRVSYVDDSLSSVDEMEEFSTEFPPLPMAALVSEEIFRMYTALFQSVLDDETGKECEGPPMTEIVGGSRLAWPAVVNCQPEGKQMSDSVRFNILGKKPRGFIVPDDVEPDEMADNCRAVAAAMAEANDYSDFTVSLGNGELIDGKVSGWTYRIDFYSGGRFFQSVNVWIPEQRIRVIVNGQTVDFDGAVALMDDHLREQLSGDLDLRCDTQAEAQVFIDEYCARHLKAFGHEFVVN